MKSESIRKASSFGIFFIIMFYCQFSIAQEDLVKVQQFENSLLSNQQIKDSTKQLFNIEERMKFRKVPALSISVIKNGQIVLSKSYGNANITKNIKSDNNTLFHFASVSKTANALCIMKLVEEGKLSLTADFREYIKDGSFKENKYSKGQKITIANLLSHTAGINRDDGPSGDYSHDKPLPTIIQIVKGEKPALGDGAYCVTKLNEAYQYSNQAICILQKILHDNFDKDYNRLLTSTIFNPLQMSNSTFVLKLDATKQSNLACGYVFDYQVVPQWVFPCQAEGGLVSTSHDIAKMVIAIQNSLLGKDNALLKKETVDKMVNPQLESITYTGNLDLPYKNGLGLMLFEKGGRKYFTHTGSIDGYTSIFIGSIDGIDGAVITLNSSYGGIIPEVLNSVATTFEWDKFVEFKYNHAIPTQPLPNSAFIGKYKLPSSKKEYSFSITQDKDHWYIQTINDGHAERLYFSSENNAFVLSRGYTLEFTKGNSIILKNNGEYSGEVIKTN
jgi:CubicO group peptidase (beta-lactamase class C family)